MNFYVKVFTKKDGNNCIALVCYNGRIENVLSFDRYIIADYLGIKKKDVATLPLGVHHVRKE